MGESTKSGAAQQVLKKKGAQAVKKLLEEEIGRDAVEGAVSKTLKKGIGFATLFIEFVETYSNAVKQANLDYVRQILEVCPHIGGLSGQIEASQFVMRQQATVWQAPDHYWYFHPQPDYNVRQALQIYRYLFETHIWAIERPGSPRVEVADCLACQEAHGGGTQ